MTTWPDVAMFALCVVAFVAFLYFLVKDER